MSRKRNVAVLFLLVVLSSCVNQERNYKPAGFDSIDEVYPYIPYNLYLASKLTEAEWDRFYNEFPEYWKDIEAARMFGSNIKYHPWYTAYAFRWTTLHKLRDWKPEDASRLKSGKIKAGDDVFQIIYAVGPPERVIWDNDFEILIYGEGSMWDEASALILSDGRLEQTRECRGCLDRVPTREGVPEDLPEAAIIKTLGLTRPDY